MKNISLTIDAIPVSVQPGATILAAACQAGITIPTLCHLAEYTSSDCGTCGICAVACEGSANLLPACSTAVSEGMVISTASEEVRDYRRQRLASWAETHLGDCKAPCNLTCPGSINVQGYIAHIALGQYEEAVRLVMERNPFPFSVGRVCRRFCESRCRRLLLDQPVAINHLKRFAADWCMSTQADLKLTKAPVTGKRLAVVGGGPAGLTAAYYLVKNGHAVTVLEAEDQLGGLLRYGVPEHKIPKSVLDYEIATLLGLGIEVRTGTRLGRDISLEALREQYDAVLLTVGAGRDQPLRIPGAELPGVVPGLQFLRGYNTGSTAAWRGQTAAVLGGSNIAIESARCLRRLGYQSVTVVNPRLESAELPATPASLREAEGEGVQFLFMAEAQEIRATASGLELVLTRLKQGAPDKRGKCALEPIAEATHLLCVDTVVYALGQQVSEALVELSPQNLIKQDSRSGLTSTDKVYVAGEAASGSRALIQVVASARKAAETIHAVVMEISPVATESRFNFTRGKSFAEVHPRTYLHAPLHMRSQMPERPFQEAVRDAEQVRLGFDEQLARQEAERCLSCGCRAYDHCDFKQLCIEHEIDPNKVCQASAPRYAKDSSHALLELDLNKCIYCRRCVTACEYKALELNCAARDEQGRAEGISLRFNEHCVHCGNCADHCSTGALQKKDALVPVINEELRRVRTTCPYCGAGCQLQLKVKGNTIMEVNAEADLPPNYGALCVKGRFAFNFVHSRDRLTSPLIRRDGALQEATWEQAYDFIATRLTAIREQHGPDSIAGFSCARATNEENFLMQKFMRTVVGTNNIDHCARL